MPTSVERPGTANVRKAVLAGALRLVQAIAALAVVAGIVLATRMAQGPIDLNLLKPHVEGVLSKALAGADATILRLQLNASDGRAALTAFGVRATGQNSQTLARASRVNVEIDMAALLKAELRASALEVVGARLLATRDEAGVLHLMASGQSDGAEDDSTMDIAGMLRDWLAGSRAFVALPDIRLRQALLIARDGITGETLWRGRADAGAALSPDRALIWAEIGYDERGSSPLQLSTTLSREEGGDAAIAFAEANLAALSRVARLFGAHLPPISGALTGSARLVVDSNLLPVSAETALTGADIDIAFADGDRLMVDKVAVESQYDAKAGKLAVTGFRFGQDRAGLLGAMTLTTDPGGDLDYRLSGRIDQANLAYVASLIGGKDILPGVDLSLSSDFDVDFQDGAPIRAEARFAANGGVQRPDLFYGDVPLHRLEAFVAYDAMTRALSIKGGDILVGDVHASGEATATLDESHGLDTLDARIRLDSFPSERIAELWPKTFSEGGRSWVARNLSKGRVNQADVALTKAAGEPIGATADFTAQDLEVRYWDPMPVATNVAGVGRLIDDRLEIDVTAARSGGLVSNDVKLALIDLGREGERIEIDGEIKGPADNLLAVLDRQPLGYAKWLGVDPDAIGGDVVGRIRLAFPLIDAISVDDLNISAKGKATGAMLPNAVKDWTLEQGEVAIDVNTERLRLDGSGLLLNEPTTFAGDLLFGAGPERLRMQGSWRLTRDTRRALGLGSPVIRRRLTGVTPAAFNIVIRPNELYEIGFDADLTGATLLAQEIGWLKPKGALARLSGKAFIQGDTPLRIEDIRLTANDIGVDADLTFDPATGAVSKVSVARLLGLGHDLAADVRFGADVDDIRIYGRSIDLRPLLEIETSNDASAAEADAAASRPQRYRIDLDRARFNETLVLQGLTSTFTLTNDWPADIRARATYPGGSASLTPSDEPDGSLLLAATDFGAFISAAGITDVLLGGDMSVKVSPLLEGGYALRAGANDFDLSKFELEKIAGDGSGNSLPFFNGRETLRFDRLRASGVYRDGVIAVEKAQAGGAAVGVSARGEIDLAQRILDINGAIAPAYGVSRAIGGIPLLGAILTGSKGEGVFAATYRATGDLDDPDFKVDRLSALAPGILREVFEGADGPPANESDDEDSNRSDQ